ncbi:hypothetical protein JTE90_018267 [Oedothorax gibbosus]|uniref:Uncharacterized protein n=1 Tax=Oedothorax gibbosus TaxID=931172 RepID=A0AAV6UZ81_9ARAC|nr:hypothetical protein JTE90_018267 [Oedothorax gibbosus]
MRHSDPVSNFLLQNRNSSTEQSSKMNLYLTLLTLSTVAVSTMGQSNIPEGIRGFFFPPSIPEQDRPQEELEAAMARLRPSVEEAQQRYSVGDFSRYAAPPVTKTQCHVEVQVTQLQPGRCIRLGGQTPACQTSDYVSINFSECS